MSTHNISFPGEIRKISELFSRKHRPCLVLKSVQYDQGFTSSPIHTTVSIDSEIGEIARMRRPNGTLVARVLRKNYFLP